MRICYISHADQHYVRSWVDYFAREGHDVHVVSLQGDDVPGATTHHPLKHSFDPMKSKLRYLQAPGKVRRMLRGLAPDLVHALYVTSNGLLGALAGRHPLMMSALGSDVYLSVRHPLKRRLIRFAMNRADVVNTVSHDLSVQVRSLGVDVSKVFELTEGIRAERFCAERVSRRPGPIRVICTRKLYPFYQCDVIVRALRRVAEAGIGFVARFAATGPQEAELQDMACRGGIADRVEFIGGYQPDELPMMLADADIYVSAAPWDGTSPALLEAMAAGAFPVVSDSVANLEWLTGQGDSLLFRPGDVEGCAKQIRAAIGDERLRRDAVQPNRQRVVERGDRETNMRRFAEKYEEMVGVGRVVVRSV